MNHLNAFQITREGKLDNTQEIIPDGEEAKHEVAFYPKSSPRVNKVEIDGELAFSLWYPEGGGPIHSIEIGPYKGPIQITIK